MQAQPFPIRTKPLPGESLWSFLIRLSSHNGISILGLLNSVRTWDQRYIQKADWALLDFSPESMLDLKCLSQLSGYSSDYLLAMTLNNLLRTFGHAEEVERSRFLSGMLIDNYRFCSHCLAENPPYHRLLWRFGIITGCKIHQIPLHDECPNCCKSIRLREVEKLNICPHCGYRLSNSKVRSKDIDWVQQNWLYDAFNSLLMTDGTHVKSTDTANRLLYVLSRYGDFLNRQFVESSLPNSSMFPTLLQHARNSLSQKRTLHLSLLLSVLYSQKIRLAEFLNLEVPQKFIDSLHEERIRRSEQISCQAPWCHAYRLPGTLVKTGTTSKRFLSGDTLLYYTACTECGCQYAVDKYGDLQERTYFIEGYRALRKCHIPMTNTKQIAKQINMTEDKVRRCIAYFASRGVLNSRCCDVINPDLLKNVIDALNGGYTLKNIQGWLVWGSYDKFLLYRFHPEVMRELTFLKRPRTLQKEDNIHKKAAVKNAVNSLMEADSDITLSAVCEIVGICPETLRNWGCNQFITYMKERQRSLRLARRNQNIYRWIEDHLEQKIGKHIRAGEVYQNLGIARSVLWRTAPEVTAYISERIKSHNQQFRL